MSADADWVVLRRYDDALEAQIALDFLRDHGVAVALQGNSGATSILNRFDTVMDIRLVVKPDDLEHAQEALAALTPTADQLEPEPAVVGDATGSPYRANRARGDDLAHADHAGDDAPKQRYRRAAFALAFAVPIGGAHFYARHEYAGGVLALGTLAYFVTSIARGDVAFILAATFVVLADAAFGVRAVGRHNRGATPSPRAQVALATAIVVGALFAGVLVATLLASGDEGALQ